MLMMMNDVDDDEWLWYVYVGHHTLYTVLDVHMKFHSQQEAYNMSIAGKASSLARNLKKKVGA